MDNFVLAVAKKKTAVKMMKELSDIVSVMKLIVLDDCVYCSKTIALRGGQQRSSIFQVLFSFYLKSMRLQWPFSHTIQ